MHYTKFNKEAALLLKQFNESSGQKKVSFAELKKWSEENNKSGWYSLGEVFHQHPDLWDLSVYLEADEELKLVNTEEWIGYDFKDEFKIFVPFLGIAVRENEILSKVAKKQHKMSLGVMFDKDILYADQKEYLTVYLNAEKVLSDTLPKFIGENSNLYVLEELHGRKECLGSVSSLGNKTFKYQKAVFKKSNLLASYQESLRLLSDIVHKFEDKIREEGYELLEKTAGIYTVYCPARKKGILMICPIEKDQAIIKSTNFEEKDSVVEEMSREFLLEYNGN